MADLTASQPYVVYEIDWDSPKGDSARQIRMAVFVEEQRVPAEMELDDIDTRAVHVLALSGSVACGTGRLFAEASDPTTAHIGRMAVLPVHRGTGCGSKILSALVELARLQGFRCIILSAQTHALGFYSRHGFAAYGTEYPDAGIPHRLMKLDMSIATNCQSGTLRETV